MFLIALVVAFFFLIKPSPLPPRKLPNPNGYDDLVKAAQMFVGDLPECYGPQLDDECSEKTRAFLKANNEALKLVRLGLSRESRIPIVYTETYFSKHFHDELPLMRRLGKTLATEGKVAEKENRIDDAIQNYLDAARLHEKMRGGVMIDSLVGIAVEAIGVNSLQKLSNAMTREQRERVIKTLTELYSNRDSIDEIMVKEKAFVRNMSSLRGKLDDLIEFRARRQVMRSLEAKIKSSQTRLGLLLIDLATSNYELDKGHSPQTPQELVPEYLPFLPK